MSTSCIIARCYNGTTLAINCKFDGDPKTTGAILNKNYRDVEKIDQLISLGSLSQLGPRLHADPQESHSFNNPTAGVAIAYHRDRGDPLSVMNFPTREFMCSSFDFDYAYVHDGKRWLFKIGSDEDWKVLAE